MGKYSRIKRCFYPMKNPCAASSQGKLIVMTSFSKVTFESPVFLERIHGDICGPIHPSCGLFCYFMVLMDTFTKWSHVCLLSTRNVVFARLLTQMIKLHAEFSDYLIKAIRLDSGDEFTSQTFADYCMLDGINVEHLVAHTHTQNGLAKSLIKHLQLIARSLLMKTKLSTYVWGHAIIMHATSLVCLRPTTYYEYPPSQLILGKHQIFLIYEYLVVQFMYQLQLCNALKWVPNEDLV